MSEKKIWLWTEEEFYDTLVFAGIAGLATFFLTIGYRALNKWLEETKWTP